MSQAELEKTVYYCVDMELSCRETGQSARVANCVFPSYAANVEIAMTSKYNCIVAQSVA